MLDFIITDSEAKRLLLNRKAAVILAVAAAISVCAIALIRFSRTGPINTHHRNLSMIFMQPRRTMPRKFSA